MKLLSKKYIVLFFICLLLYASFLLYQLNNYPGLFIDEVTYFNECRSLATFGTDIHGLKHPIYLSGYWGFGQSILYSLIAVPFLKLFGSSIFVFRLPMVLLILSLICAIYYLLAHRNQPKLGFLTALSLMLTPWLFISSRWVLDCNTAAPCLIFSLIFLTTAIQAQKHSTRYLLISLSAFAFLATAYGYIVAWIYLPIFLSIIIIFSYYKHWLKMREIIILVGILCFGALPLIYFAYCNYIIDIPIPQKWLCFDITALSESRTQSFIAIDPNQNPIVQLCNNFIRSLQIYLQGSDLLPWNSIKPFGAILPIMLIPMLLGFLIPAKLLNQKSLIFKQLTTISILAMLPLLFIIKPNYNHFTLLNIQLAIMAGFGLYFLAERLKIIFAILLTVVVLNFSLFICVYFSSYNQYANNHSTIADAKKLFAYVQQAKPKHVYVENLNAKNYWVYYQLTKPMDSPQAFFTKTNMTFNKSFRSEIANGVFQYDNLYDSKYVPEISQGDLYYVTSPIHDKNWEYVGTYLFQDNNLYLYRYK